MGPGLRFISFDTQEHTYSADTGIVFNELSWGKFANITSTYLDSNCYHKDRLNMLKLTHSVGQKNDIIQEHGILFITPKECNFKRNVMSKNNNCRRGKICLFIFGIKRDTFEP